MPKILVLHGPNLNLLGTREPGHYGHVTLAEIDKNLRNRVSGATTESGEKSGAKIELDIFQSNAESALIDRIHAAPAADVGFIVINPAAFTHTSVAIRDALAAVAIPFIEVHLSNIYARETFRQHSYFSDLAAGVISGLGADGYAFAIDAAILRLTRHKTSASTSSNQHNN